MKTRIYAGIIALLFLSGVADAQTLWKDGRFGDKITGDIFRVNESDIFVDDIVKGSKVKIILTPAKKSNYRPQLRMYAPGVDFESLPLLIKINPEKPPKPGKPLLRITTLLYELEETGPYRIQIQAQSEDEIAFSGDYSLKVKIQLKKKFKGQVPIPETGEGIAEFSAHGGSTGKVILKAGPGAALPGLDDIVFVKEDGTDGDSILAGIEVKEKKKSISLKGLPLNEFGVYRIKVTGTPFASFRFKASVKPPKVKKEKVDVRDGTSPAPTEPDLLLSRTSTGEPLFRLREEEGGTNRYVFVPRARVIGGYFTDPPEGLVGFQQTNPFPTKGWPESYDLIPTTSGFETYTGRVSEIGRNALQQVLSLRADAGNPDGTGYSLFTDIQPDPSGVALGYTETRVLSEPGGDVTHVFVVTNIKPVGGSGQPVYYDVEHTKPDGTKTTYVYPAHRLDD